MPESSLPPAAGTAAEWSLAAGHPTTDCAWCGQAFGNSGTRLRGRTRCARCGVSTTSPWPTSGQLDAAYGPWYRPGEGRFSGIGDALLRRTRAALAKRLDQQAPAGPVLDVGCGDGTLVKALAGLGRRAVGLERGAPGFDPALIGADIRDDDLSQLSGDWAAIVFWHSLEHLPEPRAALSHAARLLAPGGLLVVALPNIASSQAATFGDRWLALDLPRHLVHVPSAALLAAIEELGLQPTRVSQLRGGQVLFGWAHGLVGGLPGHPDLYDAIRTAAARSRPMTPGRRAATLAAAALASPVAVVAAAIEVARHRGGTVYVEARAR
jgi:SAM-dependent methyltransferase